MNRSKSQPAAINEPELLQRPAARNRFCRMKKRQSGPSPLDATEKAFLVSGALFLLILPFGMLVYFLFHLDMDLHDVLWCVVGAVPSVSGSLWLFTKSQS
jgi:hypothetical protein